MSLIQDRKTAWGIFLCVLIVMVYSQLVLAPQKIQGRREAEQAAQQQSSTLPVQPPALTNSQPTSSQPTATAQNGAPLTSSVLTLPALKQGGAVTFQNTVFQGTLTKQGAKLESLKLRNYAQQVKDPTRLELIAPDATEAPKIDSLPFGLVLDGQSDRGILYDVSISQGKLNEQGVYEAQSGQPLIIECSGNSESTGSIKKTITIAPDSYLFEVKVTTEKPVNTVALEWNMYVHDIAKQGRLDPKLFTILDADSKLHTVMTPSLNEKPVRLENTAWSALGDKYFMTALLPKMEAPALYEYGRVGDDLFLRLVRKGGEAEFLVYMGPKDVDILQSVGRSLHRAIDLGFFAFLAVPLLKGLNLFYGLLGNYGLAIILLTLAIKLLFYPLTKKSFESMAKMQTLQPEIQALKTKYTDATELNREMLALYQKRGVNPMGGCLPMLIQIPVFFGLYSALLHSIDLRHAPFALWITDLSEPERLVILGVPLPVMILLMGASMILQQWTQPMTGMDPQQQKMMKLTPVIFTVMFIIFPMPSGLVLYWLVNNCVSITQQVYLRGHKMKGDPLIATLGASAAIFVIGFILTLITPHS